MYKRIQIRSLYQLITGFSCSITFSVPYFCTQSEVINHGTDFNILTGLYGFLVKMFSSKNVTCKESTMAMGKENMNFIS